VAAAMHNHARSGRSGAFTTGQQPGDGHIERTTYSVHWDLNHLMEKRPDLGRQPRLLVTKQDDASASSLSDVRQRYGMALRPGPGLSALPNRAVRRQHGRKETGRWEV
jgi:hypothetical protein